jgi:CRP/FNR family transcriptional regulator, cyclic AMP receptor protein
MLARAASDIDKIALLRKSWLARFPTEVIAAAAACGTVREVADGTLLHARGAEPDGLFTIASGSVRFTRSTADGHATTIALLDAPSWFGEISLFDGLPRTHDAHASGPTVILFHAKTDFKRLLALYPSIHEQFAKMLALRLRATFDMVEEVSTTPLSQRLARRLLELAHLKPSAMNTAVSKHGREVPLTQEELGQLLGKSRQSISKLLHVWEKNDLIVTQYGRISIRQVDALERIAHPEQAPGSTLRPAAAAEQNSQRNTEIQ